MNTPENTFFLLSLIAFCLTGVLNAAAVADELSAETKLTKSDAIRVLDKAKEDDFNPTCKYRVIVRPDPSHYVNYYGVQSVYLNNSSEKALFFGVVVDNTNQDTDDNPVRLEDGVFAVFSNMKNVVKYIGRGNAEEKAALDIPKDRFDIIEEDCFTIQSSESSRTTGIKVSTEL